MSSSFHARFIAVATGRCRHERNNHIFHLGQAVHSIHAVIDGRVELCRHDRDGTITVLQRAHAGDFIAEASVYSPVYHCDAIARTATVVAVMKISDFRKFLRQNPENEEGWALHLAQEIQRVRQHCEILTRKTVSHRLDGWLDQAGGRLPGKGNWKEVAAEIGVSAEALYRELGRRK